jgi:hypothetical protein
MDMRELTQVPIETLLDHIVARVAAVAILLTTEDHLEPDQAWERATNGLDGALVARLVVIEPEYRKKCFAAQVSDTIDKL